MSELLSGQLTAEDEDAVAAELDQIVADSLPEVPQKELPALPEVPDDDVQTRGRYKWKVTRVCQINFYCSTTKAEENRRTSCFGSIELTILCWVNYWA